MAILSFGLAAAGPVWSDANRRQQEQELIKIGTLYANAIKAYYEGSPGTLKRYPPALADLLLDERFLGTRRHMRSAYGDPMNAGRPWMLVRAPDGGIQGVRSASPLKPFAERAVDLGPVVLLPAQHYSDWVFSPVVKP